VAGAHANFQELMSEAMSETPSRRARLRPVLVKVPEITLIFWVLKLLTTGMGEAMSDFLGQQSVPLAAVVGFFGLVIALRLQLRQPQYRAPYYWFAVMMVAVFGTMAADAIHDGTGLGYSVTTPAFGLIVAAIFILWYRSEGTLSIHSIDTRSRECFYWAAVLGTFALGTAAGDLTAYQLNLGLWASVVLFAAIISIPAIGYWRGVMNPILAFWFAYIVTRPLGASFADGFSKPVGGGLNMGDGTVSAIALVIFVALVAYVTRRERRTQVVSAHRHHPHVPHLDLDVIEPQSVAAD
jgi:uncharacterized membrane-anchored protein